MKSSRSQSARNIRRNARRLMSESDSECEDASDAYMDSARAEKLSSRRGLHKPLSDINTNTNASIHIEAEKTLFRLSDTSDSETSPKSSKMDKKKSVDKKQPFKVHEQSTINLQVTDDENNSTTSDDISLFKPSKNNLLKYRNELLSSDDDQSKNSNFNKSDDTSVSKKNFTITETDQSGEDCILEELLDKSIRSSTDNIKDHESFFMTPSKLKNKQRIISDSSNESDTEQAATKNVINESSVILESESDDDIINSSKEIFPTPLKVNSKKYNFEKKLKDLSLIEPSDSDNDMSAHYKSTIASSNQTRPFFDDLTFSNIDHSLHNQVCQSSILEKSDFDVSIENVPNDQKVEKSIELITLDDDTPKTFKVCSPKKCSVTIDLTENEFYKNNSSTSNGNTINEIKKFTTNGFESLKMEKKRLEEIIKQFTTNIDNMKKTMKITNLHLLPDGGHKLKKAITKEEGALKDAVMQLNSVLKKLNEFPGSYWNHVDNQKISPGFYPPKSSNIASALTKKAAANIDIGAMGNKALSTYRTQQTMTLDVLHSLHKSLETCPAPNILADDPPGLKVELMPHQKHAIAWLTWRESQKPHGGVLADDMGLGKTLTMISLILKASEMEQKEEDSDTDSSFENSKRNAIKGGNLIICPASLISQWQNEVKTKLHPSIFNVVQHYGPKRETCARKLAKKDIVITTYNVVMVDQKTRQKTSPLFQIKWKRIILDEAHTIRNYKSQTSVAVSALSGFNRWALSGTPIHNKEADFFALLKFIKCRPFDDWAVWKRWVGNNDDAGKNRLSLLVKTLMLRRTKVELSELTSFELPAKNFHTVSVELFKEEKEAYEKVLLFSSSLFASYVYEKASKENAIERGFPVKNKIKHFHQQNLNADIFKDYPELDKLFKQLKNKTEIQAHHILVLLLRLRQLCCHPCLMKNMLEDESLKVDGIQNTEDLGLVDHMSRMSISVPAVEKKTLTNVNPIFNDSWVSSKMKAVCDMVKEKVLNTDDKAIIVSQWPSMLLLVRKQLSKYQVKTEMFTGAVPVPLRNKIVCDFNNPKKGPKILLLSLTAGGVGLNLVAANHLFLVDIHWNPQLEAQACDRIHRVGQTKPVHVYKFLCANTIETSIQEIQSHKLEIANNLFGGCSKVEGSKITLDDLKKIFNINPFNK